MSETDSDIPYGYCHCGCGEKTSPSPQTYARDGIKRGDPRRFIVGHAGKRPPLKEDRGYATECWIWQQKIHATKGYGRTKRRGRLVYAHRAAWEAANGPVPDGLELDHLCRVRACVNPAHLEPVTSAENVRRGGAAKLTPGDASDIRRLASDVPLVELAPRYGVRVETISRVVNGRTWAP